MSKLVVHPGSSQARVVFWTDAVLTIGAAADNDLALADAGVAMYHAQLERRDDLVSIVDLDSPGGTWVDGRRVQRFALGHRAVVRVGDVELLYLEEPVDLVPAGSTALQPVKSAVPDRGRCPNCQSLLPAGGGACPHCGLIAPNRVGGATESAELYLRPTPLAQTRGAGILPMLAFFFGLFGPLILGIGWLLAIILGFISLSLIRQRGGFAHERRSAVWGIGLGFVWLAVLVAGVFYYAHYQRDRQRALDQETTIQKNEAQIIYLLKEIATIEEFLRATQALPLENGGGGFASLADLQRLPNPFLPADCFADTQDGYLLTVTAQTDDGFTAAAVPVRHGQTGRKTFLIDQTGILRGGDNGGRPPTEQATLLPELEMGRSVYLEARERIARELLVEARRQAEAQKFDRSQFILQELKRKYVLTTTFKNFESVAQGVEQLVANAQAETLADRARATLAEGKRAEALGLFKKLLAAYPRAAIADAIKTEAGALEQQLAAERDSLAQTRWAEAVKLDRAGPPADAALAAYRAFGREFGDTPTLQANKAQLEQAVARLEEQQAAGFFTELNKLEPRTDSAAVVKLVGQLQRNYPNAPTVKANLTLLRTLQQQAQSFLYLQEATELSAAQKYLEATDRYDRALALNPPLATAVAAQLEECYFQSAELLFATNKLAEAATAYERYLQITSNPQRVDRDRLKQIYLGLGESSFLNKNYTNATVQLQRGREFFGADTKYYRMYGQSLLRQKRYAEALPVYHDLVALAKDDPQARFERGLCLLSLATTLQTNLLAELSSAINTNLMPTTVSRPSLQMSQIAVPSTVRDERAKKEEAAMVRSKQFELRLDEMLDRLRSYSTQTSVGAVIREAVRLVNEIQSAAADLALLSQKAGNTSDQGKISRARTQLLAGFTTQQDYFDRVIGEKLAHKERLLAGLEQFKSALETGAADLAAATTIEAYRSPAALLNQPLQTKLALASQSYADLKPSLEAEIRVLDEARSLIRLAVSQFKGWVIGWNLDDRIEKFFFVNFTEMADKHARGELQLQECIKIALPIEAHLGR